MMSEADNYYENRGRGYQPRSRGRGNFKEYQHSYEPRMYSYMENSNNRGNNNRARNSNNQRSRANKQYQTKRDEEYRIKKGNEVVDTLVLDFKKNLLCGFESIDEVIKAKKMETTSAPVCVPISTRTVGFSTQDTYTRVTSIQENIPRLGQMTVYQLYRVQLGMVEFKIFNNRQKCAPELQFWNSMSDFEQFKTAITSINVCTQRVGCLLKSIQNFMYNQKDYCFLFPKKQFDAQNRMIPIPELIYLTNLRQTVDYLSNPGTNREIRQNFRMKSPLPRATWGDNDVLLNADEFIPADYGPLNLITDLYLVKGWIENATTLKSVQQKWFAQVDLNKDNPGNESVLISNSSGILRCNETTEQSQYTIGDVGIFWTPEIMPENLMFYGVYNLAGEMASHTKYAYPNYSLRERNSAARSTKRNYSEIVMAIEI